MAPLADWAFGPRDALLRQVNAVIESGTTRADPLPWLRFQAFLWLSGEYGEDGGPTVSEWDAVLIDAVARTLN